MDLLSTANGVLRRYLSARGVRSVEAEVQGHRVHYYDFAGQGSGPPIVLVHGLGGSANGWYRLIAPLGKRFSRVLALDLPGSGFSPVPEGGPLPTPALLEVLRGFLQTVAGAPVFLVGTSLGGAMVLTLTHDSPELVRALGLVAPAGAEMTQEKLTALFEAMDVRTPAQARALTRRLFHRAPLSLLLFASQLRHVYSSPAVKAFISEVKAADVLAPRTLREVSVPTLLLWGKSEKLLPADGVDYFRAHLPPHAQIHVIEGFGHLPQMERPDELARQLVRFADQVPL